MRLNTFNHRFNIFGEYRTWVPTRVEIEITIMKTTNQILCDFK